MHRRHIIMLIAAATLAVAAPRAGAEVNFGVRGGIYIDQSDPFLGIEVIMPISRNWFFNPNVEHVFTDSGEGDVTTVNADVHYDLAGAHTTRMVWVGAGLAAAIEDIGDGSDTTFGLNVLAGAGTRWNDMVPYVQLKLTTAPDNDVVLAGGIRF